MSVHRADVKDIEKILFVINKSNSEAYKAIIPPEYFKEPVLTLDRLVEDFKHMTFYTYKLKDKVVGTAALKVESDDIGKIRWVYILPEHQRRGVGTSLLTNIENEATKIKLRKLRVLANENAYWARNFYTKLSYIMIKQIPRPWGDDVIYEKTLTQ